MTDETNGITFLFKYPYELKCMNDMCPEAWDVVKRTILDLQKQISELEKRVENSTTLEPAKMREDFFVVDEDKDN